MQDFYGQCGDEELILRLRDGEENITDYIMDKYKKMVNEEIHDYTDPESKNDYSAINKTFVICPTPPRK